MARTILLRRLNAAPRTRAELREDLLKRNIPSDVADRVLDRFVEVGLIDDAQYARLWVESRHRSRGMARSVLRQELRTKGIDDEDAADALAVLDDDAERARARALALAKDRSLARHDQATRTRRLVSMLVRRGYRAGMAHAVVREVVGADAPGLDSGVDEG